MHLGRQQTFEHSPAQVLREREGRGQTETGREREGERVREREKERGRSYGSSCVKAGLEMKAGAHRLGPHVAAKKRGSLELPSILNSLLFAASHGYTK